MLSLSLKKRKKKSFFCVTHVCLVFLTKCLTSCVNCAKMESWLSGRSCISSLVVYSSSIDQEVWYPTPRASSGGWAPKLLLRGGRWVSDQEELHGPSNYDPLNYQISMLSVMQEVHFIDITFWVTVDWRRKGDTVKTWPLFLRLLEWFTLFFFSTKLTWL